MKRKLASGIVAGVAALAMTAGGVTYAAFSDFGDVTGNSVSADILRLQLGAGGGAVKLDFATIKPGDTLNQAIWVDSDPASGPAADVFVGVRDVTDKGGSCAGSLSKALAEQTLGNGCTIAGNVAGGDPTTGNLSKVLEFTVGYYPDATDAASCAKGALQSVASDKIDSIAAAGSSQLRDSANNPVVLHHGDGVCLGVTATWPKGANGPSTLDAAAQGDELDFNLRVDLVQQ